MKAIPISFIQHENLQPLRAQQRALTLAEASHKRLQPSRCAHKDIWHLLPVIVMLSPR